MHLNRLSKMGSLILLLSGIQLSVVAQATMGQAIAQATPNPKAGANPTNQLVHTKQLPPAPPSTPPPNRTRSGGSLGGEIACTTNPQPLVALVPIENPVLTTAAHPTFLFYVPYGSDQIQSGEFSLLVGPNETSRLYQTRFTLPAQAGIVSLSLPELPEYELKETVNYHWYFKLYCTANSTPPTTLQVDGWIQRVALTPERQRQITMASPQIWYDSLAQVADQLLATPGDSILQSQWRQLLQSINAEAFIQEPLLGPVRLEN